MRAYHLRLMALAAATPIAAVGIGVGLAVLLYPMEPAYPHSSMTGMEFDRWCCNGNAVNGDCQSIPSTSVRAITGGYQITLKPGDHPMVTRVHVFQMEMAKVRWSTDGRFYACLFPNEDTLRCFYAPPLGY